MNARQLTVEEATALLELGADVRGWYTKPHETFADTMKAVADAKSYGLRIQLIERAYRKYNLTYWVLEE